MHCVGVIAEYNPFHIGHAHQLKAIKALYPDALIIVAMSGSFVQRGEPALFDKFSRARWALLNGAHAVIELPIVYATANAERFASGAVRLLAKLGATTLAFGAENDDAKALWQMASLSRSEEVQTACRNYLQQGLSYGAALRQALADLMPDAVYNGPNTLLGLEYVKAIQKYNLSMEILPIKRSSSHHASALDVAAPSGSALRQAITAVSQSMVTTERSIAATEKSLATAGKSIVAAENSIAATVKSTATTEKSLATTEKSIVAAEQSMIAPILKAFPPSIQSSVQALITGGNFASYAQYEYLIHYESRRQSADELLKFPDFSEGLNALWSKAGASASWSEAIEQIKSKRYTYARLQRMGAYTVLNLTKELQDKAYEAGPLYGRLLGFIDEARPWLKTQTTVFPIIQKWGPFMQAATGLAKDMALLDTRATNIRALCVKNKDLRVGTEDYVQSPLYIK